MAIAQIILSSCVPYVACIGGTHANLAGNRSSGSIPPSFVVVKEFHGQQCALRCKTGLNVSAERFRTSRLAVIASKDTQKTPPTAETGPLTKLAWYGSEAFGKVVSVFKSKEDGNDGIEDEFGETVSRDVALDALRQDYDRSYFVTGQMSMGLYEVDCEFADPFVSFKGRQRFKQNVSNLGSFMEEVSLKILDWQVYEDKVLTKWRFSCVLGLPWRPILAASGGTEHYFSKDSGKIYKHVENWDISPVDGLKQLVKPNPKLRQGRKK
eukprot:jgi/Mesen1/8817/ME000053S08226